jgi:hypothetical protein
MKNESYSIHASLPNKRIKDFGNQMSGVENYHTAITKAV